MKDFWDLYDFRWSVWNKISSCGNLLSLVEERQLSSWGKEACSEQSNVVTSLQSELLGIQQKSKSKLAEKLRHSFSWSTEWSYGWDALSAYCRALAHEQDLSWYFHGACCVESNGCWSQGISTSQLVQTIPFLICTARILSPPIKGNL